jgi:peptide/nickel transport system permease protein
MPIRASGTASVVTALTAPRPSVVAPHDSVPQRQTNTAWARFRRDRVATGALIVMGVVILLAIAAPVVSPDPFAVDLDAVKKPPSVAHVLGTDSAGRDVMARLLSAARVSMSVGLVAVAIATCIGTFVGLTAGYAGGGMDNLLMRLTEFVQTFPLFFAVVILVALVGPNIFNVMAVIGLLSWPGLARLVRGQVLSLRQQQYVEAARALGAGGRRVVVRHVLPGVLPYLAVYGTLALAQAILTEAALSFLGLGVQMPIPSWGGMMNSAQSLTVLESQPWLWLPPGMAIALTVLCANFVGDALRDAFDPRMGVR